MGVGNLVSGFLGGMGGNAMIGLSTIACLNGGRGRIAPLATALGILLCVSCAYSVLNFIPMAALAGIMIVVVMHTFKWFSLPMLVAALLSKEAGTRPFSLLVELSASHLHSTGASPWQLHSTFLSSN